jgi:hypothetical protein
MFMGVTLVTLLQWSKKALVMSSDIEIKCINKTPRLDPHDRIRRVGGVNPNGSRWSLALDEAIAGIVQKKWRFWTSGGGKPVWVVIANHNGHSYLKTEADGMHPNNLLSLPECPGG